MSVPAFAILALFAEAPVADPAYPAAEVLEAYGRVCERFDDVARARDRAVALGWEAFEADASSEPGRSLAQSGGELGETLVRIEVDRAFTLRRTVGSRTLFLVLIDERYPDSERLVHSRICSVHDYDAPSQIDENAATRWAGRAPDARVPFLDAMMWEPGLMPGTSYTSISFNGEDNIVERGLEVASHLDDWR